MTFTRLTAKVRETGEFFVLYDGKEFKNFDRLRELAGNEYHNLNDDLMNGPEVSTWGTEDPMHPTFIKYNHGEAVLHIDFAYNSRFVVRDKEAGNVIEEVASIEEGKVRIKMYEEDDECCGTYEPDFYEVVEIED